MGGARREEVTDVYETPLLSLVRKAAEVHAMHNDPQMVTPPIPTHSHLANPREQAFWALVAQP